MSIAIHIPSELIDALIKYNLEINPAVSGRPASLMSREQNKKSDRHCSTKTR